MNHLEYIKEVENANTVFIFIHGIVGSPNHFDDFIFHVPSNYSIYNILLEGHGKSVKDFSKASKTKWEKQVENLVHRLSTMYDNIYLVAHSMGTLLSIQNAIKNKKVNCKVKLNCDILASTPIFFSKSKSCRQGYEIDIFKFCIFIM